MHAALIRSSKCAADVIAAKLPTNSATSGYEAKQLMKVLITFTQSGETSSMYAYPGSVGMMSMTLWSAPVSIESASARQLQLPGVKACNMLPHNGVLIMGVRNLCCACEHGVDSTWNILHTNVCASQNKRAAMCAPCMQPHRVSDSLSSVVSHGSHAVQWQSCNF